MPKTIEAEVIEVDGKPFHSPETSAEPPPAGPKAWTVQLDRRWWPLWLVLGTLLLVVGTVVGAVVGLVYALLLVLRTLIRWLLG